MKKTTYISLFSLLLTSQVFSQYAWTNVGNGANLGVQALAADTATNTLYLGGVFTTAGVIPAVGIAKWDGANYSNVGNGSLTGVGISALYYRPTGLVAGGTFTDVSGVLANNIAEWNGSNWSPLASGLDVSTGVAIVKALAVYKNELYAGGIFTQSGATPVNNIAKWDGANWIALTSGVNGTVSSLCVYNNELYVGGTFTNAGGVAVNNIAKWDSTNWGDVGGGVNYTGAISVSALQVYNGDLYAGGTFTTAGTTPVNHIARWDGNNWFDVGGGANYTGAISVSAFEVFNGDLVTGGMFDNLGGATANFVGKWNGTAWSAMGTGMNNEVKTLRGVRDTLYAGGSFTTADANVALFIAQWKPSSGMSITSHGNQNGSFMLYPNPVQNKLIVRGNAIPANKTFTFTLYDGPGKEVMRKEKLGDEIYFDRKAILPGLYFYKITDTDNKVIEQGKIIFAD